MHQFAGQSPDDKIKFLFKVYDLDGKMISHLKLSWELVWSTLHFVKHETFHTCNVPKKALISAILQISSHRTAPCTAGYKNEDKIKYEVKISSYFYRVRGVFFAIGV